MDIIAGLLQTSILAGGVLALAALGEVLSERVGVVNLGVEGLMALGAITAIAIVTASPNPVLGLIGALGVGFFVGMIFASATVVLRANQVLCGLALTLMGTGLAATIGNMLEFYDFITYSFFAIEIGHTFFPAQSEYGSLMLSLATFGVGFVTRPIGGIVLGIYSDRVGRRPAMLLSFALMGGAFLAITLTPSYNAIGVAAPIIVIVARMVQGFALGGEVGVAADH